MMCVGVSCVMFVEWAGVESEDINTKNQLANLLDSSHLFPLPSPSPTPPS